MADTVISIPLDAATARVYLTATPTEQQRIQVLLRLRLREIANMPRQSLSDLMNSIGEKAEARGMTPEILEDLLRDE